MGEVFLSYAREDERRARQVADAIEKAGHNVWWDRDLASGTRYGEEIEQALKGADAVVVLWSRESITSPWVRDEAAAGRDAGKLVPARIDGSDPPLGFRQYHTTDLSRWRGSTTAEFQNLLRALAAQATPSTRPEPQPRPRAHRASVSTITIGIGLCAALVVAALAAWWMGRGPSVLTIAVIAADPSPESNALARDVLVKLGSLQAAQADSMRLVQPNGGGARPNYAFKVTASKSSPDVESTVVLIDSNDQSLLWSGEFKQPSSRVADLKQQVGVASAHVLGCMLDVLSDGRGRTNEPVIKSYLNACARFAEKANADPTSLLPAFLDLIGKAPRLRGGWAKLLLLESAIAPYSYLQEAKAVRASLPQHIVEARKIDPDLPEAFVAEATLLPQTAFGRRLTLLQRAVEIDPENADVLAVQSEALRTVGRDDDAVRVARRAAEIDPLAPNKRDALISTLVQTGRSDAAFQELRKAEELWPGASNIVAARFAFDLRYGDPNEAMRIQKSGLMLNVPDPLFLSFLEARIDPSVEKIERALTIARAAYERFPGAIFHYAQALATFGREEDLFRVLLDWRHPNKVNYVTDVLFRPTLRKFRQDPRMMQVAKRLGLLEYWSSSGQWPDFCEDPALPYDCKEEAAKLSS
jgi:tetratricopeptide (TPR) repeat protein